MFLKKRQKPMLEIRPSVQPLRESERDGQSMEQPFSDDILIWFTSVLTYFQGSL